MTTPDNPPPTSPWLLPQPFPANLGNKGEGKVRRSTESANVQPKSNHVIGRHRREVAQARPASLPAKASTRSTSSKTKPSTDATTTPSRPLQDSLGPQSVLGTC